MRFDEHGHVLWTPKTLYELAKTTPTRLVNGFLMTGTPWAFPEYENYCAFLEAVAERTGVHPRNLYLRGSCHIGFSIAPNTNKVWTAMRGHGASRKPSDLDLVIVDEAYFTRFEREVTWWESRNPHEFLQGKASNAFVRRQRDRQFNCCRTMRSRRRFAFITKTPCGASLTCGTVDCFDPSVPLSIRIGCRPAAVLF